MFLPTDDTGAREKKGIFRDGLLTLTNHLA
jgi:hypothetical protein